MWYTRVGAYAEVPEGSGSLGLCGVGVCAIDHAPPSLFPPLALSPCLRSHKLPQLRTSFWIVERWGCLLAECTRILNPLLVSGPLTTQEAQKVFQGTCLLWPPHWVHALLFPTPGIWDKARIPTGPHSAAHPKQPPGDST